ncbi:MAG: phosphate signaling complex protein PhoU [Rickettsiales bacterium]|nr:phosphate signaling complex protein PhoU [Rickettsiales bacterium]
MTLSKHTVKSYDNDLQNISATIEKMLDLAIESIDMVLDTIKNNLPDSVEKITAHDYKINSLDFLIERKITAILALRQPMAVDLRYIVSAIKVSSNLERIGDQAKSIIKKIINAGDALLDEKLRAPLLEMISLSKIMVKDSVKAFNNQDIQISESVLEKDDEIDEIYSGLFQIIDSSNFDKVKIAKIINVMFIAKSFERLADHATNIAEINKYVVTGETK